MLLIRNCKAVPLIPSNSSAIHVVGLGWDITDRVAIRVCFLLVHLFIDAQSLVKMLIYCCKYTGYCQHSLP